MSLSIRHVTMYRYQLNHLTLEQTGDRTEFLCIYSNFLISVHSITHHITVVVPRTLRTVVHRTRVCQIRRQTKTLSRFNDAFIAFHHKTLSVGNEFFSVSMQKQRSSTIRWLIKCRIYLCLLTFERQTEAKRENPLRKCCWSWNWKWWIYFRSPICW